MGAGIEEVFLPASAQWVFHASKDLASIGGLSSPWACEEAEGDEGSAGGAEPSAGVPEGGAEGLGLEAIGGCAGSGLGAGFEGWEGAIFALAWGGKEGLGAGWAWP